MLLIIFRKKDYNFFMKHEETLRSSISDIKVHNLSKTKYKDALKYVASKENGKLLKNIIKCFK